MMSYLKERVVKNTLFVLSCFVLFSCNKDNSEKYQSHIDTINKVFIEDRRVDRLDVEIKKEKNTYVLTGLATNERGMQAVVRFFDSIQVPFENRVLLLPEEHLRETYALVRLANCNLRSVPKHSGELATQAVLGTPLKPLKKEGEWYMVQTPESYIAYVDEDALTLLSKSEYQAWLNSDRAIFMGPHAWIYNGVQSEEVVSDIVAGSVVEVLEEKNAWTKIRLPDGRVGFLDSDELISLQYWSPFSGEIRVSLLDDARQFLGVPYLWGGTSAKGFDCSGFTKTVFALNGMLLPRDASQQVHAGVEINTDKSWKNLEAGDLLFFGRKRQDGTDKITHVAIYMGDGRIIHAAGMVKIESLIPGDAGFAKDRYDTFITAKRMWDGEPTAGIERILSIYK